MFTAWILLMLNSLFFTLRLSGGEAATSRPLKAEEERMYLERMAQGDLKARNILIEHNLRLVAHIMKKYYTPNGDQDDLILHRHHRTDQGDPVPSSRTRTCAWPPMPPAVSKNEILMHFRAQRKLQGEVSLSDSIDGDGDGNSPVADGHDRRGRQYAGGAGCRDSCAKVRRCVKRCLDERRP